MNLHNIVRKSVTAIHADKDITVYKYAGKKNNFGVFSTVYKKYTGLTGNLQPDDKKDGYINKSVENETTYRLYIYADEIKILNVFKAQNKGNDFIICDGITYKVVEIIEDFSQDLWLCARISLQSEPINFEFVEDAETDASKQD